MATPCRRHRAASLTWNIVEDATTTLGLTSRSKKRAAQGWCQYGSPAELPGIKHKREYEQDPPPRPDWRITCIFVDKRHRGRGVARAGLEGALDQIARLGGGLVEAIPEVTAGREAQGRFLFSATVELFEQYGFTRGRQVGKHA